MTNNDKVRQYFSFLFFSPKEKKEKIEYLHAYFLLTMDGILLQDLECVEERYANGRFKSKAYYMDTSKPYYTSYFPTGEIEIECFRNENNTSNKYALSPCHHLKKKTWTHGEHYMTAKFNHLGTIIKLKSVPLINEEVRDELKRQKQNKQRLSREIERPAVISYY